MAFAARASYLFILISLFFAACSSPSSTVVEEVADEIPVDRVTQLEPIDADNAQIRLEGAIDGLRVGSFVELVPRGPWPGAEENRPAQAVLEIVDLVDDHALAIVIGQRERHLRLSRLFGRVSQRPTLPLSKSLTRVLSRNTEEARLAANFPEGVAEGDYFFVLGEPHDDSSRLGSRIAALLQVVEVGPSGSRATIVHETGPFQADDFALFAHHVSPQWERPEALILFTRTAPDVPLNSFQLPSLATAVFDYQAEFQVSNIRVETLDVFIDPGAYNAVELAQDMAPDEGFGVIVFGQEREDHFLYNITTYGATPSLATTVGILPGGLPLATPEGLEELSTQLAPSFLATALAQRGEHAEVIFFLEQCLREGRITGDVAFHAREHLALRYESIGRPREAHQLMSRDILRAGELDNPYAVLNALSIREFLNRQAADYESELADLDSFLDGAEDLLPEESLIAERLERTRVLGRLDRFDEAIEGVEDVIHQARRQESLRWEVSAVLSQANLLYQNGQVEEAVQAVSDGLPNARLVGDAYPRYSHALLAQLFAELDVEDQAMSNLQTALSYASTDGSRYSMASTFELAANLHYNFDRVVEAVTAMRQASQLYGALEQHEDRARALIQTGMLELSAVEATTNPAYLEFAYDHLAQAAEAYLAIGDGLSAAQAYGGLAMINSVLGNSSQALAHFGGSIDLGQAYNDPATVAIAYQRSAEIYANERRIEDAQLAIQAARIWAETFDLVDLTDELAELEQYLQSEI